MPASYEDTVLWQHSDPFEAGTLIRADALNVKFDGIAAGFSGIQNLVLGNMIVLPQTMQGNKALPEKTMQDAFIWVNGQGDMDIQTFVQLQSRLNAKPLILPAEITTDFTFDTVLSELRYYSVNSQLDTQLTVAAGAGANEVGTVIYISRYGPGEVRIQAATGVTINSASTNVIRAQYSMAMLVYRGGNEWDLAGDLVAFD